MARRSIPARCALLAMIPLAVTVVAPVNVAAQPSDTPGAAPDDGPDAAGADEPSDAATDDERAADDGRAADDERAADDGRAADSNPAAQHDGDLDSAVAGGADGGGQDGADAADRHGDADGAAAASMSHAGAPFLINYYLESVEVEGNDVTSDAVVRRFVPLAAGDILDVDDPAVEAVRWQLLGTGFFNEVRLHLRRGSRRGWVILVIEVEERNTLVIQQLALGISQGLGTTRDVSADLVPYAGVTVAETNLLGLGMGLSISALASKPQQGIRGRFTDPLFLGSDFQFSASAFYNNGREFFGGDDDVSVSIVCPPPIPGEPTECPPEVEAKSAVVFYQRYGLSLGTGHDLGNATRYTLDWEGELVDVGHRPDAASESRGDDVDPIDFAIDNGQSIVSTAQFEIVHDLRDDPALPSRGTHVAFRGDLAGRVLLSDYDFIRLQGRVRHWIPLPWSDHHLRFGVFAGVLFGRAPFFYRFYAADLSDLIPSRILEMSTDRRPPPDLLGTAVAEMRAEEFAARIDLEYGLPLYRGGSGLRAVDAYFAVGVYSLADFRDLRVAIPGYEGLSRVPMDLTFDLGVRADTNVGVFQVGFSNFLGFFTP